MQFLSYEDGSLLAEVVSNYFLVSTFALSRSPTFK